MTHDTVHASNLIYESKMPNYLGLQIPVMQFWNLDVFENLLLDYSDKEIIQFLKFGWPINHDGRQYSNGVCENWKGAKLHANQVNKYLTRKPVGFMQSCFLYWFPCGYLNNTWCPYGHHMASMWKPCGVLWKPHSIHF